MAMDSGKMMILLGALGAGGYIFYEYSKYSSAINTATGGDPTQIAAAEQALPFFTFLAMNWGGTGTAQQVQIYQALQAIISGAASTATATPGTTSTSQPTSVSTVPGTTGESSSSTAPSTVSRNLPPNAPARVPINQVQPGLALQMQNAISMTVANADQWNNAYAKVNGKGIDAQYGFNFDSVYGPVVNGARSSGTMSAQVFLNIASSATGTRIGGSIIGSHTHTLHGLGTIVRLAGPALNTTGNLIYQAHHPFPYAPTYNLRGLGAVVQASGFEKALFTDQRLRSNRV